MRVVLCYDVGVRVLSGLLPLLLILAAPSVHAEDPPSKPQLVAVTPGVVGQTEAEARAALTQAQLTAVVLQEASEQVGRVVYQRPRGGTRLQPGARVVIHVGIAADIPTVMPRMVGRDIDDVRARYAGLYVLVIAEIDGKAPGIVMKQDPAPGTKHPYRGRVRIEVVRRPFVVPQLVGADARLARAQLERDGFRVEVTTEERPGVLPGRVLSQHPAAHTTVPRGAVVKLVVSGGSAPVPVPSRDDPPRMKFPCPAFVGLSFQDAHVWARSLELVPRFKFVRIEEGESLRVLEQDHTAAEPILPGAVVHLTVGRRIERARDLPVPLLLGVPRDEAVRVLQGLGYRVRLAPRPSALPMHMVFEQLPPPGRPAAQGSDLVLFVSRGLPPGSTVPTQPLPDVRGKSAEAAMAALFRAHFDARLVSGLAPDKPLHHVIAQRPGAHIPTKAGSAVRLVVPARAHVPDVTGLAATEVRGRAMAAGLVFTGPDPVAVAGGWIVISQTPSAGTFVASGSPLTVEFGPPPDTTGDATMLPTPDLRGLSMAEARAKLQAVGLELRLVGEGAGAVESQVPAPGAPVAQGSTVTVTLGR